MTVTANHFPRFFSQARIRPQIEIGAEVSPSVRSLDVGSFARMFESLVTAADAARGAGAVGAWARVENAACARRLWAIADVLEARLAADGWAECEQWCIDNWDVVAAEVAAAQSVSLGVAAHQPMIATALRGRLPRVGRGIRRRTDFLPPGQRHRVSHRVDPRLRGAGHGRHRIGRGCGGVGVAVGGQGRGGH